MPHQLPASRGFLLQNRETIYSGKTRGVVSLVRLLEICSQRGKSDGKYCYRRVRSQKKKKEKKKRNPGGRLSSAGSFSKNRGGAEISRGGGST